MLISNLGAILNSIVSFCCHKPEKPDTVSHKGCLYSTQKVAVGRREQRKGLVGQPGTTSTWQGDP